MLPFIRISYQLWHLVIAYILYIWDYLVLWYFFWNWYHWQVFFDIILFVIFFVFFFLFFFFEFSLFWRSCTCMPLVFPLKICSSFLFSSWSFILTRSESTFTIIFLNSSVRVLKSLVKFEKDGSIISNDLN